MREIVLHIGLPKTATTFLQVWLSRNRKLLAQHGVWAPPRPIVGHRLAVEAITNPVVCDRGDVAYIKTFSHEDAVGQVRRATGEAALHTLAISSEYFHEADPHVVKAEVAERFDVPVRIILMLRRQDRLMESAYNQSVKRMGLRSRLAMPGNTNNLDWWRLITRWADVFGLDRIAVLNFDRSKRDRTTLQDFLASISPALAEVDLAGAKPVPGSGNESLPADLLEFKRLANQFGDFGLQDLLQKMMSEAYESPAFRMPAEMARNVIEIYRESNDRVAREILHMDGPLFPDYVPEEEKEGIDLSGQLSVEAVAAILAYHIKETSREISQLKKEIAALKQSSDAANP